LARGAVKLSLGQEPIMSQVAQSVVEHYVLDPYEIGWYIESADEEIYGPVSRKALRRFLEEKTITPNTLIRHCTQPEARPAADQPGIMDQLNLDAPGSALGDRLAEAWPRKKRDRQALAENSLPCAWHKKPAVLVCVRCHAPYCERCRAKPFRKQFFLCRRCQANMHNRRFLAYMLDLCILVYLPIFVVIFALAALSPSTAQNVIIVNLIQLAAVCLLFVRDSLFGGAGIGKRIMGLRVVRSRDGMSPLTFGQGILRWLSQFIPIFNLVDALVPYWDPLLRRYGDRWAGTRVLDSARKLAKARAKIAQRLFKKRIQPPPELGMTMEDLARLA
jgi:uncharacterized RDD family membrane protein YckC